MDFQSNGTNGENDNTGLTEQNVASNGVSNVQRVIANPAGDNVLVLPAGVTLDDIEVQGRDLVINLPDGTQMIVVNGAIYVPEIVIDGVTVPPMNLAALLDSNLSDLPEPAAGSQQSSGGDFSDPVNPIDPAYDLGDLLPYTELFFPEPTDQEIIPELVNEPPAGTPAFAAVSEEGLDGGNADSNPAGSDTTDSAFVSGSFDFTDPNGDDLTYSLDLPTGTFFAADGTEIFWSTETVDGIQTLTGSAGEDGPSVIRVVLNTDTGEYDVYLDGPFYHGEIPNGDGNIESAFDIIFSATVDDGTESVPTSLTVTIEDDGPSAFTPDHTYIINAAGEDVTVDLNFTENTGTDGYGSVIFDLPDPNTDGVVIAMDTNGNTLTYMNNVIYLFGDGTSTLYGSIDAAFDPDTYDPNNPDDSVIFTVDLNGSGDAVVTVLQAEVSNGIGFSEADINAAVTGGNTDSLVIGLDNNDGRVDAILNTTVATDTVNTSTGNIGLSTGNSFSDGEALTIDFAINVDTSGDGPDGDFEIPSLPGVFADKWYYTTSFQQDISFVGGKKTTGLMLQATYETSVANGPDIIHVIVFDADGNPVYDTDEDSGVVGGVEVIFLADGDVSIQGLQEDWDYFIETDGMMTGILVEGDFQSETDRTFKLGIFSLGGEPFQPITLQTDIIASDGDGDTVSSSLEITFLPDDAGNIVGDALGNTINGTADDNIIAGLGGIDTLNGLGGDDTLYGGDDNDILNGGTGDDVLDGGAGDDTLNGGDDNDLLLGENGDDILSGGTGVDELTGGAGADTFVVDGSAITDGEIDTVTDYTLAQDDVIDLSNLLTVAPGTNLITGGYVFLTDDGSLMVDLDGGGDDYQTVLTLSGNPAEVDVFTQDTNGATVTASVTAMTTPIVFDLNGDGVAFVGLDEGVTYDYGSGLVTTAWISGDGTDAILIYNETQIVFGHDGMTDLEGLAADFDLDGDNFLSGNELDGFAMWVDDGNAQIDANEIQPLSMDSIALVYDSDSESGFTADGDVYVFGTAGEGTIYDTAFLTASAENENRQTEMALVAAMAPGLLVAATVNHAPDFANGPMVNFEPTAVEFADAVQYITPREVDLTHVSPMAGKDNGNELPEVAQNSHLSDDDSSAGSQSLNGDMGSEPAFAASELGHSSEAAVDFAPPSTPAAGPEVGAAVLEALLNMGAPPSDGEGETPTEDDAGLEAVRTAMEEVTGKDTVSELVNYVVDNAPESAQHGPVGAEAIQALLNTGVAEQHIHMPALPDAADDAAHLAAAAA